jgi:hypothetical protein
MSAIGLLLGTATCATLAIWPAFCFCFWFRVGSDHFLGAQPTSVANHTSAFSPDARTRAPPLDLSRTHSELTTPAIETGKWPIRSEQDLGLRRPLFINGAELFEFVTIDPIDINT